MSSVVIYKLPDQDRCTYVNTGESEARVLDALSELEGKEGFVIAPFDLDSAWPLLLLETEKIKNYADVTKIDASVRSDINSSAKANRKAVAPEMTKTDYFDDYKAFLHHINAGELAKIVLSRSESRPLAQDDDIFGMFERSCRSYPHCYVALISTPQCGTWLIASPELLLSVDGEKAETIALAGTMTAESYTDDSCWSQKNRQEQRVVKDYIYDKLQDFSTEICYDGPRTVYAATLVHLRTDLHCTLKPEAKIEELLRALHPTPAVCGEPRDAAFDYIRRQEHCVREYYSGFSGPYRLEGVTRVFVSLRCMQVCHDSYILYAGGGLLRESDADSEWRETEAKMRIMKNIINHAE